MNPFGPPKLRDDLPRYPGTLQLLRVTGATIPGPGGSGSVYAGSGSIGPSVLYVASTQQMRTDTQAPRDREPCLVNDVNGGGLAEGYCLGRLAGSYNSLPVYEVVGGGKSDELIETTSNNVATIFLGREITDGVINSTTTLTSTTANFTSADIGSTVVGTGIYQPRTVLDGVTNNTSTLTSATANFTSADVGEQVIIYGFPDGSGLTINSVTNSTTVVLSTNPGFTATKLSVTVGSYTTITSVTNATTVTMSKSATATASGVTVTIATGHLQGYAAVINALDATGALVDGSAVWFVAPNYDQGEVPPYGFVGIHNRSLCKQIGTDASGVQIWTGRVMPSSIWSWWFPNYAGNGGPQMGNWNLSGGPDIGAGGTDNLNTYSGFGYSTIEAGNGSHFSASSGICFTMNTGALSGSGTANTLQVIFNLQYGGGQPATGVFIKSDGPDLPCYGVFEGLSAWLGQTGSDPVGNQYKGGVITAIGGLVSYPASSTSTGTKGQLACDGTYFYVCTGTNAWKRVALSTF